MNAVDLEAGRQAMRPLAGDGLGRGVGLPQDRAPAGQGSRQAWLREMERAQMADWFQSYGMAGTSGTNRTNGTNGKGRGLGTAATLSAGPAATPARLPRAAAHASAASGTMRPVPSAVALPAQRASVASGWPSPSTARPMSGSAGAPAPLPAGSGLAAAAYAAADVGPGAGIVSLPGTAQAASLAALDSGAAQTQVRRTFIASAMPVPAPVLAAIAAAALDDVSMPALPAMAEQRAPGPTPRENTDVQPRRSTAADANRPNWQSSAQSQGMRMHAQWTDSGVLLWLGMDGNARQTGAQALAVVHSLQRLLRDQGQQLSRLVCNGQLVFDAATGPSDAMRAPHGFSDIFDRLAASRQRGLPAFPSPFSKEIP